MSAAPKKRSASRELRWQICQTVQSLLVMVVVGLGVFVFFFFLFFSNSKNTSYGKVCAASPARSCRVHTYIHSFFSPSHLKYY